MNTKKNLPDLAKAIANQKAVESGRVSIVLKKPKPGKASKDDDKKSPNDRRGRTAPTEDQV